MLKIEYHLFRVKFIKSHQELLFQGITAPERMLIAAISERPSVEAKAGYEWHIGNIREFSESTGYFAIGRTTSATIEKFDPDSGDFTEEELQESPYTHCVFDASIGFVGIAKKPNLSTSTRGIANRLEQLLSATNVVATSGVAVEVRPIPDPEGFLALIRSAFRVFRFSATFRGPNPFDADEHFQKPLSVYLSSANGTKGKATISGDDLDREVIGEVTRSTAATGNEASARIQKSRRQSPMTISLRGDPVKRSYNEDDHTPESALADLTAQYLKIRHNE